MDLQIDICRDMNEKEWNSVVYNSKHGSIFHTIAWADILEKEYGRKILIGAWLDDKLVGVFPCILGGREIFPKHIRSFRLGYDYGGPISTLDNRRIIMEMILKFEEIAKNEANKATIVTPFNWNFGSELEGLGFSKRLESTFLVDLKKPVNELWLNIKKGTRRNVRKALRNELTVRLANNRSEIKKYYEMHVDTSNRAGLDPRFRSKTLYYDIWDKLCERGLAKIFFVEFNKEIISGKVLLLFKKTITAFCSGTLSKYRPYQPNSLLTWHIIEWGNKNGFKYLDLGGGASIPNLYQFKRSWGGDIINYYIFTKMYPSLKYKFLSLYYGIRRPLYKLKKKFIKQ